ncbi:hypothetical protein [Streptomyces lomondensis]|uniref:Uncharacterized protein n=1 Tax=Streptomyces lomondensis TaxID=68229 RepID=A0ABQ2XK87_9ACTN|nr:hypothetical protein [Streptomyces lomondensis]MCF0079734.1 hypothetical protein [Streptomyces lomondensis]GGX20109.1 hypothetical protein GCM10010383_57900 [Streptomyces lomondensis]
MSHHKDHDRDQDRDRSGKPPETALEEVLREIEDAEKRTEGSPEQRRHLGEAGEAITPNTRAQEKSEGD